jgi:hypothetical protein
MPDPAEKMMVLAQRLLDRTERGEVTWELGTKWSGEVFATEVAGQFITIRARDDDANQPFVFALWQIETDPTNIFSSDTLRRVEMLDSQQLTVDGASLLAQLFQSARGRALKINESIEAALAALDEDRT